jgi:tetratricopeptide (TPR) repeat protein
MASKTPPAKSVKSEPGSGDTLRAETERLIAKERYKDAVKQAKLTFKEAATPENHRLLERAYFLRARQLVQQGMRSSAVEVAQHLLEFGVTAADSPEELVRLLAGLGFEKAAMEAQEKLGGPALKEQISQTVADQLVLHPDRANAASPELVREARLVRQSLEKLQSGDEDGAMAMLRDLARSSPLSEWKFFVRGLAAFQRGEDAETRANWDRLDPSRSSARIAGRLRLLSAEASGPSATNLVAAEKLAFGEPILERIRRLAGLVAGQEWDKVLPLIGPLRMSLHRIDPKLTERLTLVLIGSIIKAVRDMDWHEAHSLVTRFTRVAQPMPIDPQWNRLWAMIWDGPHAEPGGAVHYWTDYFLDLETVESLTPIERNLARALVWNHVATLHREEVDELSEYDDEPLGFPGPPRRKGKAAKPKRDDPEVAAAKKSLIEALEKSLRLAPDHLETYQMLVDAHHEWGDDKALDAAAKRLLTRFPEDVETLHLMGRHHHSRKDPHAALPYVQQARRLKPLDESLRILEWTIHVGLARQFAIEGKPDQGRAEFADADALKTESYSEFSYSARKAVFEYKVGQAEQGDLFVEQAKQLLVEPAPLWLSMAAESARFQMPKTAIDKYTKLWEADLKKKVRSETAGAIANLLGAFLGADTDYPGRDVHIKQVVAYLGRTSRVKYRREDIEPVADFLRRLLPQNQALYQKLVRAGVKQHPDSAELHMHAADVELQTMTMRRGMPGLIPPGVRQHLETALKLAEASTDPKVTALLPEIRRMLGSFSEVAEMLDHFASQAGGPFGPAFMDMLDLDPDDEFDDEFEEDDPFVLDVGPPPFPFPPPPRPAGPGRPQSSTKKRGRRKK